MIIKTISPSPQVLAFLKQGNVGAWNLWKCQLEEDLYAEYNLTDAPIRIVVDLSHQYLHRLYLPGGDLIHVNLTGADLTDSYLPGAFLREATVVGASCQRADLRGAICRGADFTGADLRSIQAQGADFDKAKLDSAHLADAIMTRIDARRLKELARHIAPGLLPLPSGAF